MLGLLVVFAILLLIFNTGILLVKLLAGLVAVVALAVFAPVIAVLAIGGGIFLVIIRVFLAALRFVF